MWEIDTYIVLFEFMALIGALYKVNFLCECDLDCYQISKMLIIIFI